MFMNPRRQEYLSRKYLWLWIALAAQAGFVNAGGFLACARFVSHMTGFGTQVGISLSQLDYLTSIELFCAPASFLFGAMASGVLIDRSLMFNRKPRYLSVMFGIFLIFLVVTAGGALGSFGDFGEPLVLTRDFELLSLLCFACGLQNACFGSLSRGQIRTTHMTGILTDIGVSFVKLFLLHGRKDRQTTVLQRVNFIRILTFISFSVGSAVSALVFKRWQYMGFVFPTVVSLLLFLTMAYKQSALELRTRRRKDSR